MLHRYLCYLLKSGFPRFALTLFLDAGRLLTVTDKLVAGRGHALKASALSGVTYVLPNTSVQPHPPRRFYGWWIAASTFVTFGIAVGVPYYNLPFFYDYFQKTFHWNIGQITLGFPLAALLTIWVGPVLIPRFSPRRLILVGTGLTAVAFFGFGAMHGALAIYFLLYFVYTVGYIFSGPIPHQLLVSYWFRRKRGRAMGFVYVGVGLFGGLGSFFVRGITDHYGFRIALFALGGLMFLTWPFALLLMKDRPSEINQYPDGAPGPPEELKLAAYGFGHLLRSKSFWLLLLGSVCSIGSIGSINTHMKFVFRDAGFVNQNVLNATWTTATALILWSSIAGRLQHWVLRRYLLKETRDDGDLLYSGRQYPAAIDGHAGPLQLGLSVRCCFWLLHGRGLHAHPAHGRRAIRRQYPAARHGRPSAAQHHRSDLVPLLGVASSRDVRQLRCSDGRGVRHCHAGSRRHRPVAARPTTCRYGGSNRSDPILKTPKASAGGGSLLGRRSVICSPSVSISQSISGLQMQLFPQRLGDHDAVGFIYDEVGVYSGIAAWVEPSVSAIALISSLTRSDVTSSPPGICDDQDQHSLWPQQR